MSIQYFWATTWIFKKILTKCLLFWPHKKVLTTTFKGFQIRCPRFTFKKGYRNKFCLAIWHVGLQHFWPIISNGTIPILLCIDWNFNLDNWQFYELCIGTVYCIHRSTVSMTHQIEIQRFQKYLFMKLHTYIHTSFGNNLELKWSFWLLFFITSEIRFGM